jgi:hypothetical protein
MAQTMRVEAPAIETTDGAAVAESFLACLANANHQRSPFDYWLLTNPLPAGDCEAIAGLPIAPPAEVVHNGRRETNNSTRIFFTRENQEKFPVVARVAKGFNDPRVRAAVGRNPAAPDTALDLLTRDQEPDVLEAVASNPALSDERFAELFENTPTQAGTKVIPALFKNGPRGAYAYRNATMARGLLYVFAVPFALGHLVLFAFGGKVNSRHVPAGHPVALQTLAVAAVAFVLARALYPLCRLTAAKLRARSAWPTVGMWVARVALTALLAAQVRACVVL